MYAILLLILTAPLVIVQAEASVCDPGWSFHSHTRSCMKVFTRKQSFSEADQDCQRQRTSGATNQRDTGRLVVIFDQETNTFVKELIADADISNALIGLTDDAKNGLYYWKASSSLPAPFLDWATTPHKSLKRRSSVLITQKGWKEVGGKNNNKYRYICQVNAAIPEVSVTCPQPVKVGQTSHPILCHMEIPEGFVLERSSFAYNPSKKGLLPLEKVLTCHDQSNSTTSCTSTAPVDDNRYSGDTAGNNSQISSQMTIGSVSTSDNTEWFCKMEVDGFSSQGHCRLPVYELASHPDCDVDYDERGITAVCTIEKTFPAAKCSMQYTSLASFEDTSPNTTTSLVCTEESTEYKLKGHTYFRTTCTCPIPLYTSSIIYVQVEAWPDLSMPVTMDKTSGSFYAIVGGETINDDPSDNNVTVMTTLSPKPKTTTEVDTKEKAATIVYGVAAGVVGSSFMLVILSVLRKS